MIAGLPRRTLLALVGVLLFYSLWEGYGRATAGARLAPEVREAMQGGRGVDIVVRLPFAPEQFHVKLFQGYGTVSAVRESAVVLRRVPPARVDELARFYWVERIDLARE